MIEARFLVDLLFDLDPIIALQRWAGQGNALPFEILSFIGDTWGMLFIVGLALWCWGRRTAYGVAGTLALGAGAKAFLTEIVFHGERPEGPGIVVYEEIPTGSFPSGHVFQAVAAWGWLAAIRRIPYAVPLLFGGLVALGRLYLAAHYLGDVLAGLLFGVLFVVAYTYAWPHLRDWFAQRSFRFFVLLGGVVVGGVASTLVYSLGSPHRWGVVGVALGLTAGLLLEYRYVRFEPADAAFGRQALKVAIGLAGIVACLAVNWTVDKEGRVIALLCTTTAGVWALVGAPLLFKRLGWHQAAPAASAHARRGGAIPAPRAYR